MRGPLPSSPTCATTARVRGRECAWSTPCWLTLLLLRARARHAAPPPPAEREWQSLEAEPSISGEHSAQRPRPPPPLLLHVLMRDADPFTVMSYNVLCEKYATPTQYGYTPSWALAWDSRREVLIQEIKAMDAD